MLIKHIALVSESDRVPLADLVQIAAAVQKQVIRDFGPIWEVQATIAAFAQEQHVPDDYWTITIRDNIGSDAAGMHLYEDGQPYALVDADSNVSITCSHEVLEMLADPFGNRLVAGPSLKKGQGRVNYLVEVCDPSQASNYTVNDIPVSDFYTPAFFSPVDAPGTRYSFTGAIPSPRTIIRGGYISWMIPETGEWWQQIFSGSGRIFRRLGMLQREQGQSWRAIIDQRTSMPHPSPGKKHKQKKR